MKETKPPIFFFASDDPAEQEASVAFLLRYVDRELAASCPAAYRVVAPTPEAKRDAAPAARAVVVRENWRMYFEVVIPTNETGLRGVRTRKPIILERS